MKTNQLLEAFRSKGLQLCEKWSRMPGKEIRGYENAKTINFLQGMDEDDEHKKMILAQLLENTHRWLQGLDESTRTMQVGSFEKFVFPIVRAVMANLVAQDLVSVHPLDAPTGLVFNN